MASNCNMSDVSEGIFKRLFIFKMKLHSESMASAQLRLELFPKYRGSMFFGTILMN